MTAVGDCRRSIPLAGAARQAALYTLECVDATHPDRDSLEAFIAKTFLARYGAEVQHFCTRLSGCRAADGRWLAAVGYTPLEHERAFLEHYLDVPLEQAIGARLGMAVERSELVEAGNLAALDAGAARALIIGMTHHLHAHGFKWVALTATRALLNSFARLRIQTCELTEADPRRLPDQGKSWGSYYDSRPHVMYGNIASGHARLHR